MNSIDLMDHFNSLNSFEKCDLSCPTSPRDALLEHTTVNNTHSNANELLSRLSLSIPVSPEESYDFFESSSAAHFNNAISSEEPFAVSSPPHLNKQSSDLFVSFESEACGQRNNKRKIINESVKFVCVRASCRRKSRKCGQQALQRFRNANINAGTNATHAPFHNNLYSLQLIEGNHYYNF